MRSALFVLIVLAVGVVAAFWLRDLGGAVDIQVGQTAISLSFPIALLLLVAAFLLFHGILSAIGALRRWPARTRPGWRSAAPAPRWATRRRPCCWPPRPSARPGARRRPRTPSGRSPSARI